VEQVVDFIVTVVEDTGTELSIDPVTGFVGLPEEFATAGTPFSRLPIPVTGSNFAPLQQVNDGPIFFQRLGSPRDYCDDGSVMFDDGTCYPLLRQGPCPDRLQWLTLDPITLRVIMNQIIQYYNLINELP